MKNFDQWNELKKHINHRRSNFFVKERQIWYVHLGHNVGFEEDGKGGDFKRPVLILKKV